jgi:ParB family chromosome partitioning protein
MNKRGGLGRGLAALIPTGPAPDAAPVVRATPADGAGPDREPGAASLPQVAPTVTLVPDPAASREHACSSWPSRTSSRTPSSRDWSSTTRRWRS